MKTTRSLLQQVRGVKTLDGGVPVYKDAQITLVRFFADSVYPISKYVLRTNIEQVLEIERSLTRKGLDIFDLRRLEAYEGFPIAPPIVEWDGSANVIVDGIHRFFLARQRGCLMTCVYIKGVNPDYPVIGLPVPWDSVLLLDSLPEDPRMRRNLRPDIEDRSEVLRKFYRDLSPLGSKGRRPSGTQKS